MIVGPSVWWFRHRYFDMGRAVGLAVTVAVLVAGALLLVAVVPSGRWRGRVLVAVPGVWFAALGAWLGVVWLGSAAAWLLVALGLVVVGGSAELWLWWWGNPRRRIVPTTAGTLVLLALVPTAFVYWVWHQSAHLGTAGEPDPKAATVAFMADLAPAVGTVDADIDRLICRDDPSGRRDVREFVAAWRKSTSAHHIHVTWLPDRPAVAGDKALVPGTVMMDVPATDGSATTYTMPKTRWTLRLAREDGWRVCGLRVPGWSPSAGSPSPTPSLHPSSESTPGGSASPSDEPSPTDDDAIPGGAPSDMQKCGPDDPYKGLGWYDCP